MDNSMSINLEQGINSMNPSLTFFWKAFFADGSIIEQFENGIENKFQLIKDNFDKLIRFSLVNKDYSQCFTIDLQKGFIIYNNYRNINTKIEKKENVRLIFFRRHRVTLTQEGKEMEHVIHYHLGFQYSDKNGNNRQIVLEINSEGNFILGS
jgi:hypothetical protein